MRRACRRCVTIQDRCKEAVRQLWHTSDDIIRPRCKTVGREIGVLVTVDFHVVFDKSLNVTNASAVLQEQAVDFLENYHFELFFDNSKTYFELFFDNSKTYNK